MRFKIALLFLMLLCLPFQNCGDSVRVNFFNRISLHSATGGGPYEGKPDNGYYCRVFDNMSCQSQVQNLQGLIKVDNSGIHLVQDSCTSTSVNFLMDDSAVEFSSLAPNFLGVSRGIFRKCEVGSNNLPAPAKEMTDAYCVSHQDNMAVVLNKDLASNSFTFDIFFNSNSKPHEVHGGSIIKSKTLSGDNYFSMAEEFNLEIKSSNSQTAIGHLQVVINDEPLSVDLNCRVASPIPTVVIKEDLEISSSWIDTSQLVGYWKLNETNAANGATIVDSSSYGANGTLATDNGGLIKSDSSAIGGSLFFDGNNDAVEIPLQSDSHLKFDMRSFSYMAWIKRSGDVAANWYMPFYRGGSSAAFAGYDIECRDGCAANISDGLRLPTSKGTAAFTPNGNNLVGRWVLLAAVVDRDRQQLRTYVDGVLIRSVNISQVGSINPDTNLSLGSANINWQGSFFWGLIDDVAIWNKALSENEIKEIFQRLRPKFY